jgi:hypothetical protein
MPCVAVVKGKEHLDVLVPDSRLFLLWLNASTAVSIIAETGIHLTDCP